MCRKTAPALIARSEHDGVAEDRGTLGHRVADGLARDEKVARKMARNGRQIGLDEVGQEIEKGADDNAMSCAPPTRRASRRARPRHNISRADRPTDSPMSWCKIIVRQATIRSGLLGPPRSRQCRRDCEAAGRIAKGQRGGNALRIDPGDSTHGRRSTIADCP